MPPLHLHALVPMKQLTLAKSRLATALDPPARRRLARAMLEHVLAVLISVPTVVERIWVISHDRTVRDLATARGASPLIEQGTSLNEALEAGRIAATAAGATGLLVLPADVPLVASADIEGIKQALVAGAAVVLTPDSAGTGTNALGLWLPSTFPFQFGTDSFQQHRATAAQLGLTIAIFRSPRLALDVDTPEQLTVLTKKS